MRICSLVINQRLAPIFQVWLRIYPKFPAVFPKAFFFKPNQLGIDSVLSVPLNRRILLLRYNLIKASQISVYICLLYTSDAADE